MDALGGGRGRPWTRVEVEAAVAAYLDMLRSELRGLPYVKSDVVRDLQPLIPERSRPSIERKFQNISAYWTRRASTGSTATSRLLTTSATSGMRSWRRSGPATASVRRWLPSSSLPSRHHLRGGLRLLTSWFQSPPSALPGETARP